jgi:hypothetical protein
MNPGGTHSLRKLDALTKYGSEPLLFPVPRPRPHNIIPIEWTNALVNDDDDDEDEDDEDDEDEDDMTGFIDDGDEDGNDVRPPVNVNAAIFVPLFTTTSASDSLNTLQDLARLHIRQTTAGQGAAIVTFERA